MVMWIVLCSNGGGAMKSAVTREDHPWRHGRMESDILGNPAQQYIYIFFSVVYTGIQKGSHEREGQGVENFAKLTSWHIEVVSRSNDHSTHTRQSCMMSYLSRSSCEDD